MGRKKTYTSATVVSLVTDFPNLIQQSVVMSIANETDIGADLVTNMITSSANKFNAYYHTGKHHVNTIDLIPKSTGSIHATRALSVKYVLTTMHSASVKLHRCVLEPLDTDYLAYEYMAGKYGFNYLDGSFTSLPNGLPIGSTKFGNSGLRSGQLYIEYVNQSNKVVFTEYTNLTGINTHHDYYHVLYYVEGNKQLKYWNYNTSLGTYPYLNQADYGYSHDYFPVVPIIQYGTNVVDNDTGTKADIIQNTLLRGIGLKRSNISDALKESESYNDIKQAHFMPSIRIRDNDKLAIKYIFYHFVQLASSQKYGFDSYKAWLASGNRGTTQPPLNLVRLTCSSFKLDMSWIAIDHKIVNKNWTHGSANFVRFHNVNDKLPAGSGTNGDEYLYDVSTITYLRKISATQQEQVTMYGFNQTNYVDDQYSLNWDTDKAFNGGESETDPVVFPLIPAVVTKAFPKMLDRNNLYYRSYNLVITMKKIVKMKWYQTGFFKFVMVAVAIVFTVWTGIEVVSSLVSAFNAGVAAGGLAAGLAAIGMTAMQYAFTAAAASWAMQEIVERYGWEIAAIVSVVLMGIGYKFGYTGNMTETILTTINKITSSITDYFENAMQEELDKSKEDLAEYNKWKEEYDTMMDTLFGLGDSFADAYKAYSQAKAISGRMLPDTYLFSAIDMLTMIPEMSVDSVGMFVDNSLTPTTDSQLL